MFRIDPMSRCPVYEQLIDQVERYILTGVLHSGDQLPSVRSLSVSLSVNPNTIQKVYSHLDSRKIIFSVPGKGCFVSEDAKQRLGELGRKKLNDLQVLLAELKLAGIESEEVQQVVRQIFDERGSDEV